MLQIFDSLTKAKRPFEPIEPGKVKIYVCGITVYDYCHIGHARGWVIFDMVARYLRYRGYDVTLVRNITDIDDKIINRARENKVAWDALAQQFIDAMHEDESALGVMAGDLQPRATEYIPRMLELIQKLIAQGHAYVADNGDVYFDVLSFKEYGKLSHRDVESLRSGVRIDINEAKREPLDFVLWKMSKADEPSWESKWGKGRPGWHIECSAMSTDLLGQPFDIHGGGMDLKFPHHENEIAQSEAACGKEFARTWMHVGLLQVNKEKMSKSLGNFFTVREVLAEHNAEVVRYFMISGHYRSPVSYSEGTLEKMLHTLRSLYIALRDLPQAQAVENHHYEERFVKVMDDDFNTPEALAILFEMAHEINRLREEQKIAEAAQIGAVLKRLGGLLGILQQVPEYFLQGDIADEEASKINALIAARNQARQQKQWSEADRLRGELTAMGVMIEDTAEGTSWRKI